MSVNYTVRHHLPDRHAFKSIGYTCSQLQFFISSYNLLDLFCCFNAVLHSTGGLCMFAQTSSRSFFFFKYGNITNILSGLRQKSTTTQKCDQRAVFKTTWLAYTRSSCTDPSKCINRVEKKHRLIRNHFGGVAKCGKMISIEWQYIAEARCTVTDNSFSYGR